MRDPNTAHEVRKLIDKGGFFKLSLPFVNTFGLQYAAFLSRILGLWLFYEQANQLSDGGRFYTYDDALAKNLAVSADTIKRLRKRAKKDGYISVRHQQVPVSRLYYRPNENKIKAAVTRHMKQNPIIEHEQEHITNDANPITRGGQIDTGAVQSALGGVQTAPRGVQRTPPYSESLNSENSKDYSRNPDASLDAKPRRTRPARQASSQAAPCLVSNSSSDTQSNDPLSNYNHPDALHNIIQHWNGLEDTCTHRLNNPLSKTLSTACSMLDRLLSGQALLARNNGAPHKSYNDFLDRHHLDTDWTYTTWTEQGICDTLTALLDSHRRCEDRLSLEQALWNPFSNGRTKRRCGCSLLVLTAADQAQADTRWSTLADQLAEALDTRTNPSERLEWARRLARFAEEGCADADTIGDLIAHYGAHCTDRYIPAIDDADDFCERFDRIRRHADRVRPTRGTAPEPSARSVEEILSSRLPSALERRQIGEDILPAARKACDDAPANTVAEALVSMWETIVEAQRRKRLNGSAVSPLGAIEAYVRWLGQQDWADSLGVSALSVDHGLYRRFLERDSYGQALEAQLWRTGGDRLGRH